MANWGAKQIDIRTDEVTFIMKRREVMRMAAIKVLEQNDIDVFVNPPLLTLPNKIGGAQNPARAGGGHGYGARLGIPEVFVPAGFADTIYEPTFALKADGTEYESVAGTTPTKLESPLPFNIAFWAGPGDEAVVLKVASAYEAATHHRRPPSGTGAGAAQSMTTGAELEAFVRALTRHAARSKTDGERNRQGGDCRPRSHSRD